MKNLESLEKLLLKIVSMDRNFSSSPEIGQLKIEMEIITNKAGVRGNVKLESALKELEASIPSLSSKDDAMKLLNKVRAVKSMFSKI